MNKLYSKSTLSFIMFVYKESGKEKQNLKPLESTILLVLTRTKI